MNRIAYFVIIMFFFGMPFSTADNITVKADQVYNLTNTTLQYDFTSNSGEVIRTLIEYDSTTPHSEIRNVNFTPPEPKKDGRHTFYCATLEGEKVIFIFEVKDSSIIAMRMDTDYKPKTAVGQEQKTLTLKSAGGYEILFIFNFENGHILYTSVKPKIHPFSS